MFSYVFVEFLGVMLPEINLIDDDDCTGYGYRGGFRPMLIASLVLCHVLLRLRSHRAQALSDAFV